MQCPKHQNVQCPRMCKYIALRENENSSTNVPVEEFFPCFFIRQSFLKWRLGYKPAVSYASWNRILENAGQRQKAVCPLP